MKRTARLITTIAAIVLTLVIMSVGIYAATQISITNKPNNIKFNAVDVAATITATKQMGTADPQDLAITSSDNSTIANGEFAPSFQQGQNYTGTMDIGDIVFTNLSDTFTLTITVTNDLSEASINVVYSASESIADKVTIGTETLLSTTGAIATDYTNNTAITVAHGETVTITTTITLDNKVADTGLETPFNFTLDLTRVSSAA